MFAGVALGYYPKAQVGYFRVQAGEVKTGDKVLITGPTTGAVSVVIDEMRVNDVPASVAKKGDEITFRVTEKLRVSDKLYRMEPAVR